MRRQEGRWDGIGKERRRERWRKEGGSRELDLSSSVEVERSFWRCSGSPGRLKRREGKRTGAESFLAGVVGHLRQEGGKEVELELSS